MNICPCDWFNKEADWHIAGQDKVGGRAKQRMMGRRAESEESQADAERRQDGHAILRKGTKPCCKT